MIRCFSRCRWLPAFGALSLLIANWTIAPAAAEPLQPARVSAAARWLIHVDLQAFQKSTAREELLAHPATAQLLEEAAKRVQRDTGIDPLTELISVTAYDDQFAPGRGVVILHLKQIDRDRLLALLRSARPEFETHVHGEHTVYSWPDDDQKTMFGAFFGEHDLLFSHDKSLIETALKVFDGDAPALGPDEPLAAAVKEGTIVLFRARNIEAQDSPFRNNLIRDARFLSITVGEYDREAFFKALIQSASADGADQIRAAALGLQALGKIQFGRHPQALTAIEKVQIAAADQTTVIDWRLPTKEVKQLAEWATAELARRRGDD